MSRNDLPPSASESEQRQQQPHGFVLLEGQAIYGGYRVPDIPSPTSNIFHPVSSEVSYPDVSSGTVSGSSQEIRQPQENMKQYYSLGGVELGLTAAVTGATYEPHQVYSPFNASDIPRSFTDEPITSAPDVLIHPPALSFHSQYSMPNEYRSTPSASPATSVGGGSGMSGSDIDSARNSPYARPVGVEDHLQNFAMMDPAYAGIDPILVSNSPPEQQPLSAGSPYGSPGWNGMHSPPPQAGSNPGSPGLHRHPSQTGRLSPSFQHVYGARHAPYPQRRLSTGSVHSRNSVGPGMNPDDVYYNPNESIGYAPTRSPSQRSNASARLGRTDSGTESVNSAHGSTSAQGTAKEGKETLCTECNKCFRDLRAHQLTHLLERPEKCPIATCEYSKKGFARKYDCQRHTLTHYKGTMVCGFCPGSGSPMEKSFNRADVFKRHLMAVHNVEQTPPNGRQRKSNTKGKGASTDEFANTYASGKCSTCSITFPTAQQFYEHLDDCVLSKVVQEEPAAEANERNLSQIKLEEIDESYADAEHIEDEEEDDEEIEDVEADDERDETYSSGGSSKKPKTSRAPSTRSKAKKSGTVSSR